MGEGCWRELEASATWGKSVTAMEQKAGHRSHSGMEMTQLCHCLDVGTAFKIITIGYNINYNIGYNINYYWL